MKDANIRSGIAFLRGNVQNVSVFFKCDIQILSVEGLELEVDEDMLSGIDRLFKKYLVISNVCSFPF